MKTDTFTHDSDTRPNVPTIRDDEMVRVIWHNAEGLRCTTWISAKQIGELKYPNKTV